MSGDETPPSGWGHAGAARRAEDRERLDATFDLMTAVLNGTRLPDMLTLLAAHARAMTRVPLAFIAMPAEDPDTLRIDVAIGAGSDRIRGLTVRRGRSMLGRAFSSRRALSARIVADQTLSALPAGPILILPLETGEATRGVLAVLGRPGAQPFSPVMARQMLLFADMSARLIELSEAHRAGVSPDPADRAHVVRALRPPWSTQA
ncbi:GAF domain-containing protein [Actinomadura macra]|uniref:GAF domain-containing protein n=1 Tax=Actinomadura macra TaxID=46164 RepID=UPI00083303A8|nr:GAF domain-containing protein [Actinomadura macra]